MSKYDPRPAMGEWQYNPQKYRSKLVALPMIKCYQRVVLFRLGQACGRISEMYRPSYSAKAEAYAVETCIEDFRGVMSWSARCWGCYCIWRYPRTGQLAYKFSGITNGWMLETVVLYR